MTRIPSTPHAGSRAGRALAGFLIVGIALAGAPKAAQSDARGRTDRIVSLGGAVTEIIYDLGLQDRIVAVDTTSLYPPAALADHPNVGYLRQVSAEGVLSMRPTLVLALDGAGPPDALQLVANAGVDVAHVADEPTPAGVRAKILAVAARLGRDREGEALAETTDAGFAALEHDRSRILHRRRGIFILSAQNGRLLVGGRKTTADGMFALAGIENAAAAIEGYKPMTDEAVVAAAPDVVVMMNQGPGGLPSSDLLKGPALAPTPAGREGRLIVMDGLYLLGFGPRTPAAARDLMRAVYPDQQAE